MRGLTLSMGDRDGESGCGPRGLSFAAVRSLCLLPPVLGVPGDGSIPWDAHAGTRLGWNWELLITPWRRRAISDYWRRIVGFLMNN